MPFGNKNNNKKRIFLVQYSHISKKKYHLSANLKFHKLDILQSLNLRILIGKILRISLKLNFIPNTLGSYKLNIKLKCAHIKFFECGQSLGKLAALVSRIGVRMLYQPTASEQPKHWQSRFNLQAQYMSQVLEL